MSFSEAGALQRSIHHVNDAIRCFDWITEYFERLVDEEWSSWLFLANVDPFLRDLSPEAVFQTRSDQTGVDRLCQDVVAQELQKQ